MKRMVRTAMTAVALIVGGATAANAEIKRVELAPSSAWNVDYSDKACTLQRTFGVGDHQSVLQFLRYEPGDKFELVVFSKELNGLTLGSRVSILMGRSVVLAPSYHPRFFSGTTTLKESSESIATLFVNGLSLREHTDGQPIPAAPITPEMEKIVDSVTIQRHGKEIVLKTGPMDKAFAVMRDCTDNLLLHWGLEPKVQNERSKAPIPVGNPREWLKDEDYPRDKSAMGKQAMIHFRLMIDTSGNVTDCAVLQSYNDPKFDELTCGHLAKRAQFQPAMDRLGKPIASYFVSTVQWVMPS